VYRVLLGKLEGMRPLGRTRRRWMDKIRMVLWGEGSVWGLVGETRGKVITGGPSRICVDNITMDLWGEGSVYRLGG